MCHGTSGLCFRIGHSRPRGLANVPSGTPHRTDRTSRLKGGRGFVPEVEGMFRGFASLAIVKGSGPHLGDDQPNRLAWHRRRMPRNDESNQARVDERTMDINAGIVDQRVRKLVDEYEALLAARGRDTEDRRRSNAFTLLCLMTQLDLPQDMAFPCLTDGGQDGGIDAIHVQEASEDEIHISIFQAKYSKSLEGNKAYPSGEIPKIIESLQTIFDPDKPLAQLQDVEARVEEIRSFIRDGAIPYVRVFLCNNGPTWGPDGEARIEAAGLNHDQVTWSHVNHDRIVELLRGRTPIHETLALEGAALFDDFQFRRVMVGRISAGEIAGLMERHGDKLLERNIRRYLGMRNRVNASIRETLRSGDERPNFYFYNNGITATCTKFTHNKLQSGSYHVRVEGLQIINGGQTCKTIQAAARNGSTDLLYEASLLVRLYQLDEAEQDMVAKITYATNHQSPIDLRDLRANDPIQQALEKDLAELGYTYRRKREEGSGGPQVITSTEAAEAVLAVLRKQPHRARFASRKLFDQYYARIFTRGLNGSEVVFATTMLREAEAFCRSSATARFPFLPYASHYLAMLTGHMILMKKEYRQSGIDHRNVQEVLTSCRAAEEHGILEDGCKLIGYSLGRFGIDHESSRQSLAAQFRRADLICPVLNEIEAFLRAHESDSK